MSLSYQILGKRFMAISGRFQTEYDFLQSMLGFKSICMKAKIFKAFFCVCKCKPPQKYFACGHAQKGTMAVFGYIYACYQMIS